ncbi:SRPBCC family protein [Ningiella sp. W23]|uniref:SRPBCC family protein n=1 Tax=Ningiella sp. W23 TaxID=3023715 RepID=UPI0037574E47
MYDFTIQGLFNASLTQVYEAFIRPEIIIKWCAPGNLSVSQFHAQVQEGGSYQMVLQSPDGFQQTIVGTYQCIERHDSLSYTWRWEDTNDVSKVDISFSEKANGTTAISLSQRGFNSKNDMLQQQFSWMACLEKLSLVLKDDYHMVSESVKHIFAEEGTHIPA